MTYDEIKKDMVLYLGGMPVIVEGKEFVENKIVVKNLDGKRTHVDAGRLQKYDEVIRSDRVSLI